MSDIRHLHRDYNNAWCGLDASHIPMTLDAAEATCSACTTAATNAATSAAEAEAKECSRREQEEHDRRAALEEERVAQCARDDEMKRLRDEHDAALRAHLAAREKRLDAPGAGKKKPPHTKA